MRHLRSYARNVSGLRWFYEHWKYNRFAKHLKLFSEGACRRKDLYSAASERLEEYHLSYEPERKNTVINDMIKMYSLYGYTFDEYLGYHFENRTLEERREFLPDWERYAYTMAFNRVRNASIFDNKAKTYRVFESFFHRKALACTSATSYETFSAFLNDLKTQGSTLFVTKPLESSFGIGFEIHPVCMDRDQYTKLNADYGNGFLAEDLIVQSDELASFHPKSVNTVRSTTIRFDDETIIVKPFLKMGVHDNIVDNARAGGLICVLDVDTGSVIAASDECGKQYRFHPDSGKEIIGFTVPRWDEAKALSKQLAKIVPDNRYTGWDLALTDEGWILVEANRRGQYVWQYALQTGNRTEMNSYSKRLR